MRGWGGEGQEALSNRALILPASFEAPKSDPQVHLFQEALLGTQYCHMCVCVCVCF